LYKTCKDARITCIILSITDSKILVNFQSAPVNLSENNDQANENVEDGIKIYSSIEEFDKNLPETVWKLETTNGSKCYLGNFCFCGSAQIYLMWFTDCTCDLVEEISNNFLF
jgi:hypothetical protein